MATRMLAVSRVLVVLIVSSGAALGQTPPTPSGHWEGAIQIPSQELKIAIDLAKVDDKWDGTITIPAQNLKGFPLSSISVDGNSVSFLMKGIPGNPTFKGTVAADAKTLSGDFSQGGATFPFALTRTGEARIEALPKSTPVTKEIEGSWEGALDTGGRTLRLTLKLSNEPGAAAKGTLVSVDQGGAEVPVAAVIQTGMQLKLLLPTIAGTYEGGLEDGQLVGTWTQGPQTFPLVFKRPQ